MSLMHRYKSPPVSTEAEQLDIAARIVKMGLGQRFYVHDMLCWWDVASERYGPATGPRLRRITWSQAWRIANGGIIMDIVEGNK